MLSNRASTPSKTWSFLGQWPFASPGGVQGNRKGGSAFKAQCVGTPQTSCLPVHPLCLLTIPLKNTNSHWNGL